VERDSGRQPLFLGAPGRARRWAENGSPVGFYLEYDTGTETLATVARKLNRNVGH
jgi:hypothetical protein